MTYTAHLTRTARRALSIGAVSVVAACGGNKNPLFPPGGELALGTWGGDGAGVIVTDSLAHVHVGCTFGDAPGRIPLDSAGRFNVSGSYLLRAYPVAVGPTMPAQFAGLVEGSTLTLTVAVNDTVAHKLVALGPVKVVFGTEPRMGPCPICKTPHDISVRHTARQ